MVNLPRLRFAVSVVGFFTVLLAFAVGSLIGDAIPHERRGGPDPFGDRIIFASVFLAGLALGIWRRLRLRELWVSLAITQVVVFLIVVTYTGFSDMSGSRLIYVSSLTVLPFFLVLLILYVCSFARRMA